MALLDISRYWGSDVSSGDVSVSLAGLHRLARQRAAVRQTICKQNGLEDAGCVTGESTEGQGQDKGLDCSVPMVTDPVDTEEMLLPVTHTIKSSLPVGVHTRLPSWISQPRLVEGDIVSASVPLISVPLPPIIFSNLWSMGCTALFPVQVKVIPTLLSTSTLPPSDVCVCAPTGCGKTLCYVVPMVTALLDCVVCQVRGVVVVPSQGLARQVAAVFSQVTAHTRVHCGLVCGDASLEKEAALISDSSFFPTASLVDIIIATPGRLAEHLMLGSFASLQFLRFLVIDEADKLLSQQMYSWLPQLLQQATPSSVGLSAWLQERSDVPHLFPSPPPFFPSPLPHPPRPTSVCASQLLSTQQYIQKLLFSATMTQDPEALALLQLHSPILFSVAVPEEGREAMMLTPPTSLHEMVAVCKASLKPLVLLHFLSQHVQTTSTEERKGQVLCFTNSRESSQRLQVVLRHFNWFSVAVVTGGVSRQERRCALQQFTSGAVQVLVCSDAMARGMDLPACGFVVNYDPPSLYQMYLHRVGRTARAGSEGQALTLLAKEQVSAFHCMLRVAHRPKMEEVKVNLDLLQPLMDQYKEALLVLKDIVAQRKL